MEPTIRVDGLSKRFRIYHQRSETLKEVLVDRRRSRFEEFWAVNDISLEINEGRPSASSGPTDRVSQPFSSASPESWSQIGERSR